MILGMSIAAFTLLHVIISLIGIVAGIPVVYSLLSSKRLPNWTTLFFITTILTSITGFFFPVEGIKPSHVVGVISLVDLSIALFALYVYELSGVWRWIYVVTALVGFYLNAFVLIAQSFLKVPALHALAPTGTELPFASAQAALLALFIWLAVLAVKRFYKLPLIPPARSV